jgi:hypothetical protein
MSLVDDFAGHSLEQRSSARLVCILLRRLLPTVLVRAARIVLVLVRFLADGHE